MDYILCKYYWILLKTTSVIIIPFSDPELLAMVPTRVIGSLSDTAGFNTSRSSAALWENKFEVHPDMTRDDPVFIILDAVSRPLHPRLVRSHRVMVYPNRQSTFPSIAPTCCADSIHTSANKLRILIRGFRHAPESFPFLTQFLHLKDAHTLFESFFSLTPSKAIPSDLNQPERYDAFVAEYSTILVQNYTMQRLASQAAKSMVSGVTHVYWDIDQGDGFGWRAEGR